jgi:site-specific recombinase XerD
VTPSKNTISWQEWIDDPSIGESAKYRRKHVLRLWATANGKAGPQEVIDDMLLDRATPYSTARAFLNWLSEQKGKFKPISIALFRSTLPGFFESVLGAENFSQSVYDRLVPAGQNYVSTTKRAPTVNELTHILRNLSSLRDRALVSLLATTGMRISEALSRKMSQIERRNEHCRIKLQAESTKSRYLRYVFLTQECIDFIDAYHKALPNTFDSKTKGGTNTEWIFPGEHGSHMDPVTAWKAIKTLFEAAGLKDKEDEIYSPHSMRKFAQSQMRRSGLSDTFVDAIVGEKGGLGAKANYIDWDEIETEWLDKTADYMTWVKKVEIVQVTDPKQEARIQTLENELKDLRQLKEFMQTFTGLVQDNKEWKAWWEKKVLETKNQLKQLSEQPSLEDKSKGEVGTGA